MRHPGRRRRCCVGVEWRCTPVVRYLVLGLFTLFLSDSRLRLGCRNLPSGHALAAFATRP